MQNVPEVTKVSVVSTERGPSRVNARDAEVIQIVQAKLQRNYPIQIRLSKQVLADIRRNPFLSKNIVDLIIQYLSRHPKRAFEGTPRHDVQNLSDQINSARQQLLQCLFNHEVYYSLCLETYSVEINLVVPLAPTEPEGTPTSEEVPSGAVARPIGFNRARRLVLLTLSIITAAMIFHPILQGAQTSVKLLENIVTGLVEQPVILGTTQSVSDSKNKRLGTPIGGTQGLSEQANPVQISENPLGASTALTAAQTSPNDIQNEASSLPRKETGAENSRRDALQLETTSYFQGDRRARDRYLNASVLEFMTKHWFTKIDVQRARPINAQARRSVPAVISDERMTSFRSASTIR